eukprot:Nk52_evm30s293 gene=Nk52_evmTU30s293
MPLAMSEAVMNSNGKIFDHVSESAVSREMSSRYMQDLINFSECDVAIIGAGPSGLACAYELGKRNPAWKIAIFEASVAPGGGAWVGGQLFSSMIVRKPAQSLLDELEVAYDGKLHNTAR